MPKVAVLVSVSVKPEHVDSYVHIARRHARRTLDFEPECHRFEVMLCETEPTQVLLNELYEDEAAYEAHAQSERLHEFRVLVEEMIHRETHTKCRFA
ncbi:MAG: antibiotic biosynthesis monooxygenase [Gammaproteobacteria bacterium]|nr:antibiotic biosynthesis monooxygenase [Gammaproteobacteria bacterium]